jgi:hypothetical protein
MQIGLLGKKSNLGPVFTLASLGLSGFTAIAVLFQGVQLNNLTSQRPHTLVQLADGRTALVSDKDGYERTSPVIKRFVADTLTHLLSWNGLLPKTDESKPPERDPGVEATLANGNKARIPTAAWESGFAVAEGFREEFLRGIAQITPPEVFQGRTQVAFIIRNIGEPKKLKDGMWKVSIVADQVVFRPGDNLGTRVRFNKDISIRAVDPPSDQSTTDLQKVINRARQSGLEIYAMADLKEADL